MKNKTFAVAKFEIEELNKKEKAKAFASIKTLAATQKDLLQFATENKQEDLLYFKAVYATCGFNLNDDVFINEEFWNARKTPVLKPTNWQHKDSDIIGVIYAVEAQYLDGTPIDIENVEIPAQDFELVVHGVVYKYTFAERAAEIETRSKNGELYVSMETWFDDFAYALLDEDTKSIQVVSRNQSTAGLDKYLRCCGGVGKYNGKRIGRVLKGMTFGGMGIVDQPANPRSGGEVHASDITTENTIMAEDVREAVKAELEARATAAKVSALEGEVVELKKLNATASENLERVADKAKRAEEAKSVADAILAVVDKNLDDAIAGLGTSAPPEIAKIDAADSADAKFAAKIAWLAATAQKVGVVAEVDGLKKEIEALKAENTELKTFKSNVEAEKTAAAKKVRDEARKAELKSLLGDVEEKVLDSVFAKVIDLDDAAYAARVDEYKVFAAKAKPVVDHTGGQGSVEAEGASGEQKAASGPREDHKVSVTASLENAEVEEHVEPKEAPAAKAGEEKGLADILINRKKVNKE
jgi:hypothetical protein